MIFHSGLGVAISAQQGLAHSSYVGFSLHLGSGLDDTWLCMGLHTGIESIHKHHLLMMLNMWQMCHTASHNCLNANWMHRPS